jgi:hypothetical protein
MPQTLKISAEERANRSDAVEEALASVRLEGLEPGPEALAIFQRHVDGDLNMEEAGKEIEKMHDRKYGPVRLSENGR